MLRPNASAPEIRAELSRHGYRVRPWREAFVVIDYRGTAITGLKGMSMAEVAEWLKEET